MATPNFPGISNIEAILRQIATAISTVGNDITAVFPPALTSSVTWNPPSVASGSSTTTVVTVQGASLGMAVIPSFSLSLAGLELSGYISASNTATCVLSNLTGGAVDLGSGTLKVRVIA